MRNKFNYLVEYSNEEIYELTEEVYNITELISQKKMDEAAKNDFLVVIKKIIQRCDFSSLRCVCLLRDIMTVELYDFLFDELKKDIFISETISIEIMKIITVDNFPEYYAFLETVKNNSNISLEFRNFIHKILQFEKGEVYTLGFPLLNQKSADSQEITIDWSTGE